jgi:hypothetical protein
MKKRVVKAINRMSEGQPDSVRREMKRKWSRTPWVVREELLKKMKEEAR